MNRTLLKVVISDEKIISDNNSNNLVDNSDDFTPRVVNYTDYYAFGMALPDRKFSAGSEYRFGFNGKEKDSETGTQDYGMRIYDNRLAKFLSADPIEKEYPWLSVYQFAANTPIQAIDIDGLEIFYAQNGTLIGKYGTSTEVRVINANQLKKATEEFKIYNDAVAVDPAATSQYIEQTLLVDGSVSFDEYFETVKDVAKTSDKNFHYYAYDDDECGKNCATAAKLQMAEAGSESSSGKTLQMEVDNRWQKKNGKPELEENSVGAAIRIMTQLKKGKTVLVGVEVDYKGGAELQMPPGGYVNNNALTSHFVVINSSSVENGKVTFGYIDNAASTKKVGYNVAKAYGTSKDNTFSMDSSTGKLTDDTKPLTGRYGGTNSAGQPIGPSTGYKVTEVR